MLCHGRAGISYFVFLLLWFVAVANASPRDEFFDLLVDAWSVEGSFSSPKEILNSQMTGMDFIHHALSEAR